MSEIKQLRKDYHIQDDTFSKIMDLMETVHKAIESGEEYSSQVFERKMKALVKAPLGEPEYDYHMVIDIAEAFAKDGKWVKVYTTLYQNELPEKSSIENIKAQCEPHIIPD